MKQKDFLARLINLEVKPGEQVSRDFNTWRKSLSDEDMLDYGYDLGRYAMALGITMEQFTHPETIEDDKLEALTLYGQALWRAHALGPEIKERVSMNQSRFLVELKASDERMERMLDKASVQEGQALERKDLLESLQEQLNDMRNL